MFKNKTNEELIDSRPALTRAIDGQIFKLTKPNLETYKKSPLYRGVVEWNSLPAQIRNINSLNIFKIVQKKWMLAS